MPKIENSDVHTVKYMPVANTQTTPLPPHTNPAEGFLGDTGRSGSGRRIDEKVTNEK